MKVAFEAQLLLKENKTGIAWCADNLIRTLAADPEYQCQLNYFSKGYSEKTLEEVRRYQRLRICLKECKCISAILYKLLWPFFRISYSFFFGCDSDITQFFNYVVPPGVTGKKITIIYDMAHLACPETVRMRTRMWLWLTLKQSCKRADYIIAISEFTKAELIKYFGIPENKIKVMHLGVDFSLYHTGYETHVLQAVKEKYGIQGDYVLYLGTIEPRKNLQRLIEAYTLLFEQESLHEKRSRVPKLVLAGGNGWLYDDIYRAAEKMRVKKMIIFTGYVAEADAPLLMAGAKAFCFPSIYEGFGMPPIEAMACGTPVLAANAASLPEVLGDTVEYIDPFSVQSIIDGLRRILFDESVRKLYIQNGLKYVERYSWENSVKVLKQVYQEIAKDEAMS